MNKRIAVMALSAALLAVPTVAAAKPGAGKGAEKHAAKHESKRKSHKPKHAKRVMFVFKGTFAAPGTVTVTSGNAHVRKGGFVGQAVSFDLANAKIVVADTNGDGTADLADVKDGDQVLVQARVAKRTKYAAPAEGETAAAIVARKLIVKAAAPVEDGGDDAPATEPETPTES